MTIKINGKIRDNPRGHIIPDIESFSLEIPAALAFEIGLNSAVLLALVVKHAGHTESGSITIDALTPYREVLESVDIGRVMVELIGLGYVYLMGEQFTPTAAGISRIQAARLGGES